MPDEARENAMIYMQGWTCGAAFLPIPCHLAQNPIFSDGWLAGRAAKRSAADKAEARFGYKFRNVFLEVGDDHA